MVTGDLTVPVAAIVVTIIALVWVKFGQELSDVLPLKPSVSAVADAVGPYYPAVAPSSHRVFMDMEKLGYRGCFAFFVSISGVVKDNLVAPFLFPFSLAGEQSKAAPLFCFQRVRACLT